MDATFWSAFSALSVVVVAIATAASKIFHRYQDKTSNRFGELFKRLREVENVQTRMKSDLENHEKHCQGKEEDLREIKADVKSLSSKIEDIRAAMMAVSPIGEK